MMKIVLFLICIFTFSLSATDEKSFDTILIGGIYSITLRTGDIIKGIVEEKNDSSLIVESQGKPYKFKIKLIRTFSLIASPKPQNRSLKKGFIESEVVLYEELIHKHNKKDTILITINNGAQYKGFIHSIDSQSIILKIKKSKVPISRSVISKISVYYHGIFQHQIKNDTAQANKKYDTVFACLKDDLPQGTSCDTVIIIGKIFKKNTKRIIILDLSQKEYNIPNSKIYKLIRHTSISFEDKIKIYSERLICPPNMVYVDIPPTTDKKPFFKVCVDRYEYPNIKGTQPLINISFREAKKICERQGKRLCTSTEWQWACSGIEGYPFPYGHNLEKHTCNREGMKKIDKSGSREECVSKFGIFDMVGNVYEWVFDKEESVKIMGGPYSQCKTISAGIKGQGNNQIGFRCCKSN